ncbi:ribonuclease [Klebsiella phage KpLz-2_45]|uniref:ribonuclease n=1 Tax=Klebsiella phage KpLz-2_45 TaxID=2698923 RepID=UPI001F13ED2B|nr:ribonuclease [Klebsiella phage KpLz-2_45]UKS72000.1 ribonuclease H [Klebsiella phage KpLz-2_45]
MKIEQPWEGEFPEPGSFNLVLFCDGGSNTQTLLSGWGIHGYSYPVADKKEAKIKKAKGAFTNIGYVDGRQHRCKDVVTKADEETGFTGQVDKNYLILHADENKTVKPVNPISFIDAYGGQYKTSNNFTELMGMLNSLTIVKEKSPKESVIFADSKYVLEGLLFYRVNWERNGWLTADRRPVQNKDLWQLLCSLFDSIVEEGKTRMLFGYIPGHAGYTGNERADYNANRGMILERDEPGKTVYLISDRKGYVQNTKTSNRLLEQRWWYALTDRTHYKVDYDDRYVYFFGNHGNDTEVDMIGKATATAKVAILFAKEKEPVLELLGEFLKSRYYDGTQIMTLGHLENILNADRYVSLIQDKRSVLWDDAEKSTIRSPDKVALIEELRPTFLGFRLLTRFETLLTMLGYGFTGKGKTTITDITSYCVKTTQEGKKKPVTKPTEAMDPPNKAISVTANYQLADGTTGKATIKLKIGQDIPLRNTVNALGSEDLRIRVITWPDGTRAFRYATLMEVDGDTLFTASLNSNLFEITGKL